METKIGLIKKEVSTSIKDLTSLLANEHILYIKTRNFHWNLSGSSFMELHKLFEDQYTQIEEIIDEVAERIVQLGGRTTGSMKSFIENADLEESNEKEIFQSQMLKSLYQNHSHMCVILRDTIERLSETRDFVTTDFFTDVLKTHEKIQWILGKYLS